MHNKRTKRLDVSHSLNTCFYSNYRIAGNLKSMPRLGQPLLLHAHLHERTGGDSHRRRHRYFEHEDRDIGQAR